MLITDRFIFLHFPKTGGTFVSKVLEEYLYAHCHLYKKVITNSLIAKTSEIYGQHGGCNDIPKGWEMNRVLLSTIRNPYDLYVSQYEFKYWKRQPKVDADKLRKDFPDFPNITFKQFLELKNTLFRAQILGDTKLKVDIGVNTLQFIRFFFKNPCKTIEKIDVDYIECGEYLNDLHAVTFLRTECLNNDLHNFLLKQNYPEETLEPILFTPKINPIEGGRSEEKKWETYYTDELKDYVRNKEWLLFKLFKDYDI